MAEVHARIEERISVTRLPVEGWGAVATAMRLGAVGPRGFPESEDLNSIDATGVSAFPMNYNTSVSALLA